MLMVVSYIGGKSTIFIGVGRIKLGLCNGPAKFIINGDVLWQNGP